MENQSLCGGREGKIIKESNKVIRPGNVWTPYVHNFLRFLNEKGFKNIPVPYGQREDGKEIVSYVDGDVFHEGLPENLFTDRVLLESAELLYRFHEFSKAYVKNLTGTEEWMLPARLPIEVMCHGDFAPYNITFADGHVSGIIDFDTTHPGPRLWDVSYAVYRWVPFMAPSNPESRESLTGQLRRMKLFSDRYGLTGNEKARLPGMMIERLQFLISYMIKEADSGNEDMEKNIEDGHIELYQTDIEYIKANGSVIQDFILQENQG